MSIFSALFSGVTNAGVPQGEPVYCGLEFDGVFWKSTIFYYKSTFNQRRVDVEPSRNPDEVAQRAQEKIKELLSSGFTVINLHAGKPAHDIVIEGIKRHEEKCEVADEVTADIQEQMKTRLKNNGDFYNLQIKFKEFRVIAASGVVVRAEQEKRSKRVGRVAYDDVVWVVDQQEERLKITRPLNGWISRINDKHYQLVERIHERPEIGEECKPLVAEGILRHKLLVDAGYYDVNFSYKGIHVDVAGESTVV